MSDYRIGNDCIWDHCSTIATCPCCRKDAEIERLRAALQKIANHNDGELLTREADDMANIARAALDTVDEKGQT